MKDSAENAADWNWISDFIGKLPADVAEQEEVRELNAFALANAGKPIDAIAKLEALIQSNRLLKKAADKPLVFVVVG
jgi:hypothetical protein